MLYPDDARRRLFIAAAMDEMHGRVICTDDAGRLTKYTGKAVTR